MIIIIFHSDTITKSVFVKKDWRVCYVLIAPGYEITTLSLYFCFFPFAIYHSTVCCKHMCDLKELGHPGNRLGEKGTMKKRLRLCITEFLQIEVHSRLLYTSATTTPWRRKKERWISLNLGSAYSPPSLKEKKEFTRICYKRSDRDFLCVQSNIIYVNISETVLFTVTHIWWCYMFFFLLYTNRSPPYKSH